MEHGLSTRFRESITLPILCTHVALAALQMAPTGVLSHASFNHWLLADLAEGELPSDRVVPAPITFETNETRWQVAFRR